MSESEVGLYLAFVVYLASCVPVYMVLTLAHENYGEKSKKAKAVKWVLVAGSLLTLCVNGFVMLRDSRSKQ